MPRPPLPIGTFGEINVYTLPPGKVLAEAHFRMPDGGLKRVKKTGATDAVARNNLRVKLRELADECGRSEISPSTRMSVIIELWRSEMLEHVADGGLSPDTARNYESYVNNWVSKAIAQLRAREVSVMTCDRLIKTVRKKNGYDSAKSVRTVLRSICGFAVRHGAMPTNPAKSTDRLSRGTARTVRALSLHEREDLLRKLETLAQAKQTDSRGRDLSTRARVWLDLPDIMRAMLATGVRLGELLALSGSDVDAAARTVAVDHHLVRVTGRGLVRVAGRKGKAEGLLLSVPNWVVPMLVRRKQVAGDGPLFASWNGAWLDPSNVMHRLQDALAESDYGWVTSHVFRKTVATVLDEAGLQLSEIADQLGNTPLVVQKHYRARRSANAVAGTALGDMLGDDGEA